MNKTLSGFSDAAMESMLSYAWPGNVRELENAIERAVVMTLNSSISAADLMLGGKTEDVEDYKGRSLKEAITAFKTHFIRNSLENKGWNQTETAKALDIQRTYLSRLIKELSITQQKE
jgi:Nif-specific regulatory protein